MSKLNFRDGTTIPMVTLLVTNWGSWPCPPDLIKLHDAAPKRMLFYENYWAWPCCREIPDESTTAGKAYYARERELVKAIDIVEATGNLCVQTVQSTAGAL
jgi:hypothetical protein